MIARYQRYVLNFRRPSGTSRGILKTKETWFIFLYSEGKKGIGECGLLRGLSYDDRPDFESKLEWVCNNIHLGKSKLHDQLVDFPSIQMGLEMAFLSLHAPDPFSLFQTKFLAGEAEIPINGLIWMGEESFMLDQIEEKISAGFTCIKMKVGAIDFDRECNLLHTIRSRFSKEEILLRVDANGAFGADALTRLKRLATYDIHSIEQPIPAGNWNEMRKLIQSSPIPIALDEELIGVVTRKHKIMLLDTIQPQYIILKPSFIGGFSGAEEWVALARERNIDSWVTSALESNIGLNAIAQWTYSQSFIGFQGLGTGGLFSNNFTSPLEIKNGYLRMNNNVQWDQLTPINF